MYIFGITGGSGVGKSTVSEYFRRLGVYVSDADKAARAVTEKGMPCLNELKENFGDDIIKSDGTLNRRLLGTKVFGDEKKLRLLNGITHRYINEYIKRELSSSQCGIGAVDGAVIIGGPVEKICECLVVVTADRETRLNRIIKRDGLSRFDACRRLDAQMSEAEYLLRADYVIKNDGNLDGLGEQIERTYNEIKNAAEN